jgi:hypothetical protein
MIKPLSHLVWCNRLHLQKGLGNPVEVFLVVSSAMIKKIQALGNTLVGTVCIEDTSLSELHIVARQSITQQLRNLLEVPAHKKGGVILLIPTRRNLKVVMNISQNVGFPSQLIMGCCHGISRNV